MSVPSVFISYSHKDEDWKDRLVTHLGILEMAGILDLWDDRRIALGNDWKPEIENAISGASIVILMVSANFLTSKFILDEEVPKFLERRLRDGLRVIPLIVKPCAWQQIGWLSKIQGRPKDNRPLSSGNEDQIDTDLAALANEIAAIVKRAGVTLDPKKFIPLPPDKVTLAKLPSTSPDLFGRQKELKSLDKAWNNQKINILSLVAWGGVGKSALANKWLSQLGEGYRGAERVYGWSFYSQGAREGAQTSADLFIADALKWFGDPDPTAGSPWDKGERLAELIKQQRTLLILDGLEPLQNPPPVETGRIKDPGMTSLLRELARQNPGLVIISTRLKVDDLKDFKGSTAQEIDLEAISEEAGAAYLKHLGVDGTDDERKEASHDFGGHALALTLMGSYLKVVHRGDIRKRREIPHVLDEQKQGKHARRVMESYEVFLKGKPELDILRLMGLFDRPAEKGALDALKEEPAIESLTENIQSLSQANWQFAVSNLRELRLLGEISPNESDTLDCHPLLREHFGEKLKQVNPGAWRKGHSRLFMYYSTSARALPRTIEEMAPLFAAVLHGCQAGKYQEALNEVYWMRIQRKTHYFNIKKLGAIGAELSMLSEFFASPWHHIMGELDENSKGTILNNVGVCLKSLGRLIEAAELMQEALQTEIDLQGWSIAASYAGNLSELYLTIGDVTQALAYAEQSVQLANRSGDAFMQSSNHAKVADAQHQAGRLADAQSVFHEAEEIHKKDRPDFPLLFSIRGVEYCDLLLSQGEYSEVQQRANQALEWYKLFTDISLLTIALDNLSLGRAHLLQSRHKPDHPFTQSLPYLNRSVDGLRQAGRQDYLPRALLARAEYSRVTSDFVKAQRDLDEAFKIATRSGMGLYLADCHLGYARLKVETFKRSNVETDIIEARKHLSTAKEMIAKMGYHRRDKEVQELEGQLK